VPRAITIDVTGEVLILVRRPVNGFTITQGAVETMTYRHVELCSQDILLAECRPKESFLHRGNRRFLANAGRIAGQFEFCGPFHDAGLLVDPARARSQECAKALVWRKSLGNHRRPACRHRRRDDPNAQPETTSSSTIKNEADYMCIELVFVLF
jgi:hypothetical protein